MSTLAIFRFIETFTVQQQSTIQCRLTSAHTRQAEVWHNRSRVTFKSLTGIQFFQTAGKVLLPSSGVWELFISTLCAAGMKCRLSSEEARYDLCIS